MAVLLASVKSPSDFGRGIRLYAIKQNRYTV